LTCHHENSGPRYLQRGPDAVEEELSVAEAVERWPEHAAAVDILRRAAKRVLARFDHRSGSSISRE
jgi:hypothetical protein